MASHYYQYDAETAEKIKSYYDTPPLAFVHSYGCQQNVSDGEKIKGILVELGFGICDDAQYADLVLFNTCAVREHAEQRVLGNIGALKKYKALNPNMIIGICGCMVQQQSIVDKIKASYPYVDLVFGVNRIDLLPQMLLQKISSRKRVLLQPSERTDVVERIPTRRDSSFRAWLPIMNGCDNFCSYCIVPYVRGREYSRRPADILDEFKQLIAQGYKEITLLGQNVNSYGKGLEEECDFPDLMNLLCTVPGDYHIRFMTSHPKDATYKLIDTIASQPNICNHIHLPVQSGSNRVLKEMNRHYTVEEYLSLIEYAKSRIPDVTFSSDIIVGFPGETDEEFEETLHLIEKVRYMQLFTFIYSKRTGTRAAEMYDSLTHKDKADRMSRLLALQEEIAFEQVKNEIGKKQIALAESEGRTPGTINFRLRNNLVAEVFCDSEWIGREAYIIPTDSRGTLLIADLS